MVTDWVEVGDRCWARRYAHLDVTSSVVAGDDALLVVDTRASLAQGRELVEQVRTLSPLPVCAVVNTHQHFDHTYGNGALRQGWPDTALVAHESVPAAMLADVARIAALYTADPDDPAGPEVVGTEPVVPDTLLSSVWALDLGDRGVEVVHPGRGHTGGDVVVRVPDADVLLAGDLVEESAPPAYGPDCWPLEWAQTLQLVVSLLGPATAVVPGHGAVVDREFVVDQRQDVADVAGQVRALAASGVPVDDAPARGSWPFPVERLHHAVARAYAELSAVST